MLKDVEGAEYDVLTDATRILLQAKPTIFLATHGENVHADCCGMPEKLGYTLRYLAPGEIIARFPGGAEGGKICPSEAR
jgi:hypothetical protein